MTTRLFAIVCALAVLAAFGMVGSADLEAEDMDAARYCEMVHINKADHRKGWPDYEGTYDELCLNGQLRRP